VNAHWLTRVVWQFVAIASVAICLSCAIRGGCSADPGKRVFERLITSPCPGSMQILQYAYTPGREWRGLFHVRLPGEEMGLLIQAKPYTRRLPGTIEYDRFSRSTFKLAERTFSRVPVLSECELYEFFDEMAGISSYLVVNRNTSEAWAISIRL